MTINAMAHPLFLAEGATYLPLSPPFPDNPASPIEEATLASKEPLRSTAPDDEVQSG